MPYDKSSVTFIRRLPDGIDACTDVDTKRAWLRTGEPLFAAWNGSYRSDVFKVDLTEAKRRLGCGHGWRCTKCGWPEQG